MTSLLNKSGRAAARKKGKSVIAKRRNAKKYPQSAGMKDYSMAGTITPDRSYAKKPAPTLSTKGKVKNAARKATKSATGLWKRFND